MAAVVAESPMAISQATPDQKPLPPSSKPSQKRANAAAAAEFLSQPSFHRQLIVPATSEHAELTVGYAVAGALHDDAPTVLFIGGMMATRYLATIGDFVGRKMGVRMVVADRPGMGLSSRISPSQRIQVWLETVPILLRELGTQHVAIAAHSCGVVYAINTVYAMPQILQPGRPALYLFSPWVAPQHSGVKAMATLAMLPSSVLNHYDGVLTFVTKVMKPPFAFSAAALAAIGWGSAGAHRDDMKLETTAQSNKKDRRKPHERDDVCRDVLGVSLAESQARWEEIVKRLWKEDISGINGEAMLCLQKPIAGSWGICDDYETMPQKLEERIHQSSGSSTGSSGRERCLDVKVFWAETDKMVGKGGEEYFDTCFEAFRRDSHAEREGGLEYQSKVVPQTDHESLCLPHYGALTEMLQEVSNTGGSNMT
jgi:hypothetical protein